MIDLIWRHNPTQTQNKTHYTLVFLPIFPWIQLHCYFISFILATMCAQTHGEGRCPHKLIKVALFRYYVANRIAWSTYQSSQSLKILPQLDCFCLHLLFCGRLGFDKRNQYEEMASTHIHLIGACNKKIKCPRHFCTCSVHLTTPIRWW